MTNTHIVRWGKGRVVSPIENRIESFFKSWIRFTSSAGEDDGRERGQLWNCCNSGK